MEFSRGLNGIPIKNPMSIPKMVLLSKRLTVAHVKPSS